MRPRTGPEGWDTPVEGWEPVDMPSWVGRTEQYISGNQDPERVEIRYFRRTSDSAAMARVWLGPRSEGPPKHVHGGCQAAVLDELMGLSAWTTGRPCLAGTIQVEFRVPVPHSFAYTVEAFVELEEARKLRTRAHLIDEEGQLMTVATGTFVRLELSKFSEMAKS